jgi:acetyltransferase-like isoleucine patch superfamily enzyme
MFLRLLGKLIREYRIRRDPVAYARSLGVKIGTGCGMYGATVGMFGSDPYLITLGDNVHITHGVTFITHDGATLILRKEVPDLEITAPIKVGNDVYIGINSLIMPGVTVGSRCIIGAGSIVTRDVPDNSVVAGVPARIIKTTDEYLESAMAKSLHLGHLAEAAKESELRRHFAASGGPSG